MSKTSKYPRGGFTLIELLVVVLIIGILAAIALPQYKMAVGKAKFVELKTLTKAVQDAAQRYYLVNDTYEGAINNLDIELPSDIICHIWSGTYDRIMCQKDILGVSMRYYISRSTGLPIMCESTSGDANSIPNRVCQNETQDTIHCTNEGGTDYCYYYY